MGSNTRFRCSSRCICINWSNQSWLVLIKNNQVIRNIDPQKITAEKLNGRYAMTNFIPLVGAYLKTGQIVPGIVQTIFSKLHKKITQSLIKYFLIPKELLKTI